MVDVNAGNIDAFNKFYIITSAAQAIVNALDALPLALDQAGAYIEETGITLANYLTLYQTRRKDLLARRGKLPPGHPDTVATTWDISLQQVEQTNPSVADLLRLCAFLAPDAIPETIITQGASVLGEQFEALAHDPIQLNDSIKTLQDYSLIKRNSKTNTLSLHRLIQAVLQDAMTPDEQRVWAERAVQAVSEVFPFVDYGTWRDAQPYLSNADVCASLIEQHQIVLSEAAWLLDAYGRYFYYTGQYTQAESLYLPALRISEQSLGPEHSSTGNILHVLASLYQAQGHYKQAEPLYRRSLRLDEQSLGPDHPNTSATLHELARLYQAQGNYEHAEPLYLRSLRIREQSLGPDHPRTAITLESYAYLLEQMQRPEEAAPLKARAQAIRAKRQS